MASNRKAVQTRHGITGSGSGNQPRPVAVFWDIENVCAKRYLRNLGLKIPYFNQKLIGALDTYCNRNELLRVVSYVAMGHKPSRFFDHYDRAGFKFIYEDNDDVTKNSADILLIKKMAHAVRQYPEIKDFILVTGDSDFAEPVRILQEKGISVHLIYEESWASKVLINECSKATSILNAMYEAHIGREFAPVAPKSCHHDAPSEMSVDAPMDFPMDASMDASGEEFHFSR